MSRDFSTPAKTIRFAINVKFEGSTEKEKPPKTVIYAFDSKGTFLTSASVEGEQAVLNLPADSAVRTLRLFMGPATGQNEPVTMSRLLKTKAYEKRLRVDLSNPKASLVISDAIWKPWFLCPCVVRGRLVKRITMPDGTIQELPLCRSRVTICEVDSLPIIIWRLPDDILFRIRDELIDILVTHPFPPIPPPPPEEVVGPIVIPPRPGPDPSPEIRMTLDAARFARTEMAAHAAKTAEIAPAAMSASAPAKLSELKLGEGETSKRVMAIAGAVSTLDLRKNLIDSVDILRPYLCWWAWFEPFFRYRVDCIRTVEVDENGRFETTIYYPCFGDRPDLYFSAEQLHGSVWETIYAPPVRCNTYWNYQCGTEIVINVTNPSAIPCVSEDPVVPPAGILTWVMPLAVGGTKIWGSPSGLPPAPTGWVRTDGFTDYGGVVEAPFGSTLGFRQGYSNSIPSSAIKYYRWSYRKVGDVAWKQMDTPVYRHYVKQSPGLLPTFPAYPLGPNTVGTNSNLFEFKPVSPPGPTAGDPPGTVTYWPTDDFFADIYSAFLDTVAEPNGQYQIKVEVFDSTGNLVSPAPATFKFIVPSGMAADGITILAREAQAVELDAGGFIFNMQIDNNKCTASIDAPNIGGTTTADVCGFLLYDPTSSTPVTIAFHAKHPNNHATFTFNIVRGAINVAAANASGEVAALLAGPYTGNGSGDFTHDFPRAQLLGTCTKAAFSENLYVYAKATTGWGTRISSYDKSAVRAFALAPIGP